MSEFKAGDRVRWVDSEFGNGLSPHEWKVVGVNPVDPNRTVIIFYPTPGDGPMTRFPLTSSLTLIPDTVSVTVELPRDEAEATASSWPADPDTYTAPNHRAAARISAAIRNVL